VSDIEELFRKDPLSLTRTDVSEIVQHIRARRAQFLQGEKPPKEAKPRKKVDLDKPMSKVDKIDLSELDL